MLRVYNSITSSKEIFICKNNTINWYSCGPTVYDDAHLGHGSTYMAFDIIRRILQDYLHYDVIYHLLHFQSHSGIICNNAPSIQIPILETVHSDRAY